MNRATKAMIISGELLVATSLALMVTGLSMNSPSSSLGTLLSYETAKRIHNLAAYFFIPLFYVHATSGLLIALNRVKAFRSERVRKVTLGIWTVAVAGIVLMSLAPQGSPAFPGSVSASNATTSGRLSLEEVAKHSTESDCWVVIGNDVYNVTSLIDTHSGGREAIIQYCGTNATDVFFSKHGQGAYEVLQSYYIGTIGNANRGASSSYARNKEKEDEEDD